MCKNWTGDHPVRYLKGVQNQAGVQAADETLKSMKKPDALLRAVLKTQLLSRISSMRLLK
jgi:hypothetical protein